MMGSASSFMGSIDKKLTLSIFCRPDCKYAVYTVVWDSSALTQGSVHVKNSKDTSIFCGMQYWSPSGLDLGVLKRCSVPAVADTAFRQARA